MKNRAWCVVRRAAVAACAGLFALNAAAGYTPLKSLTANGSQWVNAGYVPKSTDKIEVKLRFNEKTDPQGIFCSRASNNSGSFTSFYISSMATGNRWKVRFDRNTTPDAFHTPELGTGADYVISVDGNTRVCTVNGEAVGQMPEIPAYTPTCSMSVFAICSGIDVNNTTATPQYGGTFTLYYFRIYDKDGKLVRQFVPVRDDSVSSGVAQYGLLDTQTGEFRKGLGSGSFTPGAEGVPDGVTIPTPISAGAYVQRGLVANWDGIEKADDVAADGWTDLKAGVTLGPRIPSGKSIVTGTKSVRLNGACLYVDSTTDEAAIAVAKVFAGAPKTVEISGNGSADTSGRWLSVLENATDTDGGKKRIFLAFNGKGAPIDQLCLYGGKYALTGFGILGDTDFSASMAFTALGTSTTYLDGTAKGSTAVSPQSVDPQAAHINLGAIASGAPSTGTKMEFHALRVYNVTLTPEEVKYNAWLDRVRFSNEPLPEGLFVTEEGALEAEVTVTFDETQGCVSNKGVAVQSGATIRIPFVPGSGSALLTAEPKEGFCITGVRGESAVVDRVNGTIAVDMLSGYLAGGSAVPSELEVTFGNASEHISSGAYVQRGIAVHYDAIDNAGLDSHAETLTSWKNLAAGASDLTLPAGAVVGAKAIEFGKARGTATDVTCARSTEEITAQLSARTLEDYSVGSVEQIIFDLNGRLRTGYDGGKNNHVGLCVVMPKNADLTAINTHEMYWYGSFMWDEYARDRHSISVTGPIGAPTTSSVYLDSANFKANGITYSYGNVAAPDGKLYIGDAQYSHAFNAVRLYDRKLTKDEVLFNAWVDDVRFSGGEVPDGVIVTKSGLLAVKLKVKFDATRGSVSVGGAAIQPGDEVTFAIVDGAVHLSATPADGYVIQGVEGAPADVDRTEGAIAANVLTDYLADGSAVPSALEVKFVKPSPAVSEKSYVQRGLTAQWDGIAKDADVAANGWSALKGGVTLRRMTDTGSVVTDDKYVRVDGEALWDNGDGAANVVRTVSKPGVTFEVVAKTSATTPFLFSAAKEEENAAESNRILLWYNGARTMYHASGTYPGFWTTGITPTKGVRNTEVLRYPLPSTAEFLLNGEFKGKKADLSSMTPYTGETGSVYLSALCRSNGVKDGPIDYYGIRVYDATLTDKEIKFNSDLDKVRFDGDDPAKIAWPEGVRYRGDWLEAQVTVNYDETRGTVLANGRPVASNVTTWVAIDGGAVKLTLVDAARGMGMTAVEGAPADVDLKKGEAVLIPFGRPSVTVRIEPLVASEVMYVQRGLVAHWDGVKKAADVATDGWTDLKAGVTLGPRIPDGGSIVTDARGVNLHGASLYIDSSTDAAAIAVARAFAGAQKTIEIAGNGEGQKEDKWVSVLTGKDPSAGTYLFLWYNGGNGGVALDTLLLRGGSGKFPRTGLRLVDNTDFTAALAFKEVGAFTPYQGGTAMTPELATAVQSVTPTEAHINLGAFGSCKDPQTGTKMEFHALRVYNVTLTQTEVAFNAAVDQVRFSNVSPADADWPEGISYNAEKGELEVEVTVMYGETLGSMTVNGVSVRSGVPTKVPYNMGLATVVFAPAAEFVSLKSVSAGGKKIPATDEQATIDDFLHVREIRARISGGGMRLIVR